MPTEKVLGVDIGKVIIDNPPINLQVTEAQYAAFSPKGGVFEALAKLTAHFEGKVYLVSKCTEWAEVQIKLWLDAHDFYAKTGIRPENVYCVRHRIDKADVCRKLHITHFIDDRLEVLGYLSDIVPNLFMFQPKAEEVKEHEQFLPKVTVVNNWMEAADEVARG